MRQAAYEGGQTDSAVLRGHTSARWAACRLRSVFWVSPMPGWALVLQLSLSHLCSCKKPLSHSPLVHEAGFWGCMNFGLSSVSFLRRVDVCSCPPGTQHHFHTQLSVLFSGSALRYSARATVFPSLPQLLVIAVFSRQLFLCSCSLMISSNYKVFHKYNSLIWKEDCR